MKCCFFVALIRLDEALGMIDATGLLDSLQRAELGISELLKPHLP
jgi:hypothetical protein